MYALPRDFTRQFFSILVALEYFALSGSATLVPQPPPEPLLIPQGAQLWAPVGLGGALAVTGTS